MPPVISKQASATNLEQESMPPSVHDENDISVYDSKLAYIISDVISKFKLKQSQVNSKRKRSCKFPCSLCSKNVNKSQKAIQCDQCKLWSHASCNGITKSEYEFPCSRIMVIDHGRP